MIAPIAVQEMRALLRDGRLWALGLALGLLWVVALAFATQERERAEQERHQVEATVRQQWDHQGERHPHRAAHFGLYAFKPPSALSSVEPGVDAQAGQALWLEPHKRNMAMFSPAADAAPSMGLGAFDPAFVLLALLPLLIAVVGHHTVSQEREQGILRMLHACGMRGTPWVLGKWLGLCLGVALVLAPAVAAVGWLLGVQHSPAAAALVLAALGLYGGTWAALTVLVSALCRSSRAALLVLLALWVGGVFMLPRLAASAVGAWSALPTGQVFWSAIQHDIDQGLPGEGTAAQRLQVFDAQLLASHGVAKLEDLPFGVHAKRRLFRDAYATKVYALHFARLWEAQQAQQRWFRLASAGSPYAAMQAVGMALAGTDLAHRHHFEEAAEQYRQRFTTWMDAWDMAATQGMTSFESRYGGNAQWEAAPRWRYTAPGLGFALGRSAMDWGLLAGWWALAMAGMCWSGRRLNP